MLITYSSCRRQILPAAGFLGPVDPTSFDWTPDTTTGVTGYNIGIRSQTGGTPGVYPTILSVLGQYTASMLVSGIIPPLANGGYYWAIQSVYSSGGTSSWSTENPFVIA